MADCICDGGGEKMMTISRDLANRVQIEEFRAEHIQAVRELEVECFSDAWSEKLLEDLLGSSFDKTWVLTEDKTICGYCNFRIIAGEGELMRIAVHGKCRGKGYGRILMEQLLDEAKINNISDITLEVRASNTAAIALYELYGFKKEATRKNYYSEPTEDALIYWKRGDIRASL